MVWETWVQSHLKIVFVISLLDTQQYKVRIDGKVGQSGEGGCALQYTLV